MFVVICIVIWINGQDNGQNDEIIGWFDFICDICGVSCWKKFFVM